MSSLAPARERAAPGPHRSKLLTRADRLRVTGDAVLGLGLAAGLSALAFATAGGVDLGPNAWAEIVLTALGALLAAAVLLLAAPGRLWGSVTLLLFAALAALTAASISWSVQPANSWVEANRTVSYVAAFGGAIALARLFPERWPALVGAIAVLATVISGYALLVKVFPATLDPNDLVGRVRAPFDYWNASGLIAALGLPACLWSGARRERGRVLRALSVPAIAILVTVLVLSYSRSALVVAVVGVGCWFAVVPLRLRAVVVLGLGAAGGAALSIWALGQRPFTHDLASLHARTSTGHTFGWVLLLVLGLSTVAGFAAAVAIDRVTVPAQIRRGVGIALVGLVALLPLAGVAAIAASSRGLTGEVSHVWNTVTNPDTGVSDTPGRLVELANTRPRYWREGLRVGEHALLKGVGAGGFATARTRYTNDSLIVAHAHSYTIETFADLGLTGLALSLALLVSWSIAAGRAVELGLPRGHRQGESSVSSAPTSRGAERIGLLTLFVIALMFGLHSAIDWTWFVPGTAVPALVCAGWLAGRGPLEAPIGRAPRRRSVIASPAIGAGVVAIAAGGILFAWMIWQPLRSADAESAAIAALSRGDTNQALADARAAVARDPLSIDPLFELSAIYSATGDAAGARAELARAVRLQPANPQPWETLGVYDLQHHQPRAALDELEHAHRLDLSSVPTSQAIAQARAELRASPPSVSTHRTARASSVRLNNGGPATLRTVTRSNPSSLRTVRSERRVYRWR